MSNDPSPRGKVNESGVFISRPDGGKGFEQSLVTTFAPDSPALAEMQKQQEENRRMEKVLHTASLLRQALNELDGGFENDAIAKALSGVDYAIGWAKYFVGHGEAPQPATDGPQDAPQPVADAAQASGEASQEQQPASQETAAANAKKTAKNS